jgi:hypothetical protein
MSSDISKDHLSLYNRVREVPEEAKKPISAGRLKGKTDINPLWRIQTLTREFGPAGIGWFTETTEMKFVETDKEKALYLHIRLFVKNEDGWSKPIEGFGGSMVVANEKNGLFLDDDAYKKAYTDAISQACRSLGIGADVYWESDATKYQQERNLQDALDYVESCESVDKLNEGWAYWAQWFSEDKTFRAAFVKRKKELTNGTKGK